jgi:hypothetical protein
MYQLRFDPRDGDDPKRALVLPADLLAIIAPSTGRP